MRKHVGKERQLLNQITAHLSEQKSFQEGIFCILYFIFYIAIDLILFLPLLNIFFEFIQCLASISSRFTNEENISLHHYSLTLQQYEGVN